MVLCRAGRLSLALILACGFCVACTDGPEFEAMVEPSELDQVEAGVRENYQERATRVRDLLGARRADQGADQGRSETEKLLAAYADLGRWLFAYHYDESARPMLRNAQRLDARDYQWPYLLARIETRDGNTEAAREYLLRTLVLSPKYLPAVVQLAGIEAGGGQVEEARRLLEGSLGASESSGNPRVLFELAQLDLNAGDFATAKTRLERVVAAQPQATAAQQSLAIVLRTLGETDQAAEHLALAGSGTHGRVAGLREPSLNDPVAAGARTVRQDSRRLIDRAQQYLRRGKSSLAISSFERALSAAPQSAAPRVAYAGFLVRRGRIARAIALLSEALELEPANSHARFLLARALGQDGHTEAAIEHLQKVVKADPRDGRARVLLARYLERQGEAGVAKSQLLALLDVDPQNKEAYTRLIALAMAEGRCEEALSTAVRARDLHPDDRYFAYRVAWLSAGCPAGTATVSSALELLETLGQEGNAAASGMVEVQWAEVAARVWYQAGRKDRAIDLQKAVVNELGKAGKSRAQTSAESRLAIYLSGGRFPKSSAFPPANGHFLPAPQWQPTSVITQ